MSAIPVARQKLIDRIAAIARKSRRTPVSGGEFAQLYLRGVDEDDLKASTPEDLAGAAIAHLRFGAQRQRRKPLVRVFNPDQDRDGFTSTHTVIQVTLEDMPFLVDSLSMVMSRAGLTVHRMIHPVLRVKRDRSGKLTDIAGEGHELGAESWQHIEVDRIDAADVQRALERQILDVLDDVR